MGIGPAVRKRLGRFERPAAEAYRSMFFNVNDFTEQMLVLAPQVNQVLEIGCGDGAVADRVTKFYPHAEYVGIDPADEPGRLYTGDPSRVTFASRLTSDLRASDPQPFDLILIVDVLHHIPDDADRMGVLKDAAAMLASSGTLLVKEWERANTLSYAFGATADRYVTGDQAVRFMDRSELTGLIAKAVPELKHTSTTFVRPWRCNVLLALRAA